MRPRVSADPASDGDGPSGQQTSSSGLDQLVVLIVEREPAKTTAHLRHLYRRSQDPRDRYNRALSALRAGYYQYPNRFSDAMTALFEAGSQRATRLLATGRCVLHFEQYGEAYRVPCEVRSLDPADAAYQATLYHSRLFNPAVPPDAEILAFVPDWTRASTWRTG